ncbi:MAG: S9 family peptidase [Gemmatimonadetes bacterium]|nr:S9 family peptidase [Gemmatimonadota bacterium]
MNKRILLGVAGALFLMITTFGVSALHAQRAPLANEDIFDIEYASDVQISPDATTVAYVRYAMSIMRDRREGRLWLVSADGSVHRKLTSEDRSESSPRWSPDGTRIAFVSGSNEGSEIYVYWVETGQIARLTQLDRSPGGIAWSPDGLQIAFTMLVPEAWPVFAAMPRKPAGAEWADPPIVETRVRHEADGSGVIEPGFQHIFVIPADGGSPRQITSGDFQHGVPVWAADGSSILFSANRRPGWEWELDQSDVYRVSLNDGVTVPLTSREGPDSEQVVSPDGSRVAFTSFEDRVRTYQTQNLHLMRADGSDKSVLLGELDRSVTGLVWAADGSGVYFSYEDEGVTKVAFTTTDGDWRVVAKDLGGTSVGRAYGGGNYSVARDGTVAFTYTRSDDPSEVALVTPDGRQRIITRLNGDLKSRTRLATAEMFWTESSHDGRPIQSWILHPPGFDPDEQYPLLLEIHGGPVSNYGDRFAAEFQLYATAGFVVVYSNPRGSTGYGEEFGDLLYHNYPGNDYDDLISAVDAVIERGYIDEDQLYVTGGSAGGIMTAWIGGHTNRFRAAVATKPVVNWISKTLVADNYNGYMHRRYPGTPWENPEAYWAFSPLSVVGDIETPTMVMVGTADLRTPLSEAKQLYHALTLRHIDTALVQIPGAYHNISNRPSQLIAKVINTVAWFDRYKAGTPISQE